MALLSGELRYDGNNPTVSSSIAADKDGELHITYAADKCYSAWVEILSSADKVLFRIPFMGSAFERKNKEMHITSGQKVRVCASLKQESFLRFQVFLGPYNPSA